MADSVMKMADEILGGMLTQSISDPAVSPTIKKEQDLPDLSDEQRNSFINESVVDEGLGKELKPHAKHGETSPYPGRTQKHTSVKPSPEAEKNLSQQAKQKLQRHRSRSASRSDASTSWAVDRPTGSQKSKWGAESDRQQTHKAGRGQSPRGSESKPAKKGLDTMQRRKAKLTPAHQTQMAKKAQGYVQARHDRANKEREATRQQGLTRARQTYQSSQGENAGTINMDKKRITIVEKSKKDDKWIQGAEADIKRRGTEGKCTPITKPGCTGKAKALAKTFKKMAKKSKAENAGLTRKQYDTLVEAQQILKEMTAVGSIGTTQGANMHGSANKAYDADAKPMGKDTPKIAPVDKSLRKVSKAVKGKPAAKNKKVKKEAFERLLDAILSDAQIGEQGSRPGHSTSGKPFNPDGRGGRLTTGAGDRRNNPKSLRKLRQASSNTLEKSDAPPAAVNRAKKREDTEAAEPGGSS